MSEVSLSDRQTALLIALRELERAAATVDFAELASATGYSEASVRTYFTKKLEGVLVFRDGSDWRVRGAVRCTQEAFAKRLSQKSGAANDALKSEESWRELVRKLFYEGKRRHYTLSREELDLVRALVVEVEVPRSEGLAQPSLFRE